MTWRTTHSAVQMRSVESYVVQRHLSVKDCFSLAPCWFRMVEMTAGTPERLSIAPLPSCCLHAAVTHFLFLCLLCLCGCGRPCGSTGIPGKGIRNQRWLFFFLLINPFINKNIVSSRKFPLAHRVLQGIDESLVKHGLSTAGCAKHPHWLQYCLPCIYLNRYSEVL